MQLVSGREELQPFNPTLFSADCLSLCSVRFCNTNRALLVESPKRNRRTTAT